MKRLSILLLALTLPAMSASGQSALSIVDVLSPYDLTATLLANGHFSITTKYTGEPKTLIYQEDGSGGRPVNYTSHVHFKVDDVIFQLPYELNPITREAPPEHPLVVERIFRDTVSGVPHVNAQLLGVMPDGDTMRFRVWMEPVKRPSGGFIRISAEVTNSSRRPRQVGVLMLVDTKIGDNDRAPIISAFGYQTVETEFDRVLPPGMPPFWLGIEGTPIRPGLTARGNLTASGLITPDYFLFGNWKDNTTVGAIGLALAQWNERRAINIGYTDSSVLLLWLQEQMNVGERRTRASTEIGLVDSLYVSFGSGGWGGVGFGGGGLGAGAGGCLAFDTVAQRDCSDSSFHPYAPDSLQALFLVTNDAAPLMSGTEVRIESLPAGLTAASTTGAVNPSTLSAGVTGVGTITFFALPRLYDTAYHVPVSVRANNGELIVADTLCIFVPGLPGKLDLDPQPAVPLCPGLSDTIVVPLDMDGPRCLLLTPSAEIIGNPVDVAQFSLVAPQPTIVAANGSVGIPVEYTATTAGTSHRARLVVHATLRGLNRFDRDTTIVVSDTVDLLGEGRDAEFTFADPSDTLDFGTICVGDTALREWTISNIGGCDLTIDDTYRFDGDALGQFSVANSVDFPLTIERKLDGTALVRFSPLVAGRATSRFIVTSMAIPFIDTLIVTGFGDAPRFVAMPDTTIDTICPNQVYRATVRLNNPTACPVEVDTLFSDDARFVVGAPDGFILPPKSGRAAFVTTSFANPGTYTTRLNVHSATAGDTTVVVTVVVASRELTYGSTLAMGDVRVGASMTASPVSIRSTGTAGVEITRLRTAGVDASDYSIQLPPGVTLPHWLSPGSQLDVTVIFAPTAIDDRRATLVVETGTGSTCGTYDPIELSGRGVLPIIDAPRRRYDMDRICAGTGVDTAIVVRNFGNAPLTVLSIGSRTVMGEADIDVVGLPMTIQPDSVAQIAVKTTPSLLGPFALDLTIVSDGEPFTPGDTLIRIQGSGVLCGSLSVDTVRAIVGDVVEVPIRLDASPLTTDDVVQLMNRSNARSIALSIGHDSTLMRFRNESPAGGVVAGLFTPPAVAATGSRVSMTSANANGDLSTAMVIASLRADVLLGRTDKSTLTLSLTEFADGWSNLKLHDGLLIAQYCAIDKRYVQLARPFIRPSETPLQSSGALQCWFPEGGVATVEVIDLNGRVVATPLDGAVDGGFLACRLPSPGLAAGVYIATLRVGSYETSVSLLVVN